MLSPRLLCQQSSHHQDRTSAESATYEPDQTTQAELEVGCERQMEEKKRVLLNKCLCKGTF